MDPRYSSACGPLFGGGYLSEKTGAPTGIGEQVVRVQELWRRISQIASDLAIERKEVATVADKLGLPIKLEQLYLAELKFKRAQLLEFDGRLLAQFAYLDPDGIPLSFCATRSNRRDSPIRVNRLRGLSAASWDKSGYGFVLIGAAPAEALRQPAVALSAAF